MTTSPLKVFSILFFILTFNLSALATTDVSKWSLRYLARASNLLLVTSDSLLESKPGLCEIKADEIQKMTMTLKMLVDQKIEKLTAVQKTTIDRQLENCTAECTCDVLALALEKSTKLEDQKKLTALNEKASKVEPAARLQCASSFKEFCSSQLIQALRK